jgi:hypothetical protein
VEGPRSATRIIASYVAPHAFAPRTRAALVGLGYRVVAASTRGRFEDDSWKPDLRIVDDRHFEKLPVENYLPQTPIIVLGGRRPRVWRDKRVVGEIARPAGLDEIYPLIQTALEETPRRAPRTPTQLPARCTRADQRWMGAIVSLSTHGCLFRTRLDPESAEDFNLLFPLPRGRMIYTRARVRYQHGDAIGMAFSEPPDFSQQAIGEFVAERLATAHA